MMKKYTKIAYFEGFSLYLERTDSLVFTSSCLRFVFNEHARMMIYWLNAFEFEYDRSQPVCATAHNGGPFLLHP